MTLIILQVYVDLFAVAMLLLGGALAYYGELQSVLLVFIKSIYCFLCLFSSPFVVGIS